MRRYNAKKKRKHSTKTYYKEAEGKFYPRCHTTIMRSFLNASVKIGELTMSRYVLFRCEKIKVVEVGYCE